MSAASIRPFAPNSCFSACALAWLGGRLRLLGDGADVGSHAAFVDDNGIKTEKGSANAVVGAYLSMLGLRIDAIVYLTSASPDKVVHITRLTARKYGIAVSFFDNNGDVEEIGPRGRGLHVGWWLKAEVQTETRP